MGNADLRKLLENSRLFKQFSPHVVDAVIPVLTHCQFNAGALICLKGEPSDCLYIIHHGEVEISVSSSEGKIIILGILSDGDVFGEIGLLDKGPRTANVIAKTHISLYRLGSGDFDRLVKLFGPEELMALTSYVCFLFRSVTNNLEETVFLDAGIRIAHKIYELCEKSGGKKSGRYEIEISQENLGRMAGLSRKATNKALSRLEETGIIERRYKHIVVPDAGRLMKTLEGD